MSHRQDLAMTEVQDLAMTELAEVLVAARAQVQAEQNWAAGRAAAVEMSGAAAGAADC